MIIEIFELFNLKI